LEILTNQTIDMESGSIVTALVKENTAEAPRDLAICCGPIRIIMRGDNYLLEKKVDNDDYEVLAHLKERHAVAYLLCEWVEQATATELLPFFRLTTANPYWEVLNPIIEMNLMVRNSQIFCSKTLRKKGAYQPSNMNDIEECLRVLESESLNKN
jgi:hypothetical protein